MYYFSINYIFYIMILCREKGLMGV